ncbi:uncharacterized protein PpBr36_09553 [Pyricularia pennisetigena]|uniref:uncharacterized protein n=1 Tax=Pyricularia pennisetigena TaxID=1578925 RepID=UPI001154C733|nr:uncharacterized protein PpBr36_09553 [Pyricularia pennisetigena]TLS21611.1 hypothetical protein PpBr36_09553 [Pyricularia pennisetigena]
MFTFPSKEILFILSVSNTVLSTIPPIVYRSDTAPPERLWANDGFRCRGGRFGIPKNDAMPYYDHVFWPDNLVSANSDPWIATSFDKNLAFSWANMWYPTLDHWVYAISTAGIENKCLDIEEAYRKDGRMHPYPENREIAIRDSIPWENVKGWFVVKPGQDPVWVDRPPSLSPLKPNDPRKPTTPIYQPSSSGHWIASRPKRVLEDVLNAQLNG